MRELQERLAKDAERRERVLSTKPKIYDSLQAMKDAMPGELPSQPAEEGLTQSTGTLSVARMAFTCSALLLVAITTVNTGMLSQILRDLGFIPPSLKFFGVALFYILAFLLTLVEAGIGFLHGAFSDADLSDERAKIHIGPTLAALGAVAMACVEGFFYSRIMPNRTDTVTIPLIGYTLPQTDVFFIWGFLLVMTLFGLGLAFYRNLRIVLHGTALAAVRKQWRAFTKETERAITALQRAGAMANNAHNTTARAENTPTLTPPGDEPAQRLLEELHTLLKESPPWATVRERPLGPSEVLHLAGHALLWFLAAIAATTLTIYTGIASFNKIAPDSGKSTMLGLCQAALVSTAGFLAGWGETIVQGPAGRKLTSPSPARLIGIALVGFFAVEYLWFAATAQAAGVAVLWTANVSVGIVACAACYQLIPLLGLGELWAQRLLHLLIGIGERMYRLVIATLLIIAILLEQLISLLAGPITALKRNRAGEPALPTPYADESR